MNEQQDTERETYKSAVKRYQEAAGRLFTAPSKKQSKFERNAWLLCDYSGELICIVNPESIVFGANLRGYILQTAI